MSAFGFGTWTDRLFAAALAKLKDEGASGAGYRTAANRLIRVARVDGFVTITILALMVFKPGV